MRGAQGRRGEGAQDGTGGRSGSIFMTHDQLGREAAHPSLRTCAPAPLRPF